VHTEAVEGLLEENVLAKSGFSFEARAAVGAGEQARRQGHRVTKCEGGIVRGQREKLLPEKLLDLPEVGGLTGEGGAVYLVEGREPLGVVPSEEEVDGLVGVDAEELPDHFDGEHLGVGELGGRSTLAQRSPLFESVVDEAEDRGLSGFDAARPIVAATCFHQRAGGATGLARVPLPDWRISRPHMWRPSAIEGKLMGLRKMTTGKPSNGRK